MNLAEEHIMELSKEVAALEEKLSERETFITQLETSIVEYNAEKLDAEALVSKLPEAREILDDLLQDHHFQPAYDGSNFTCGPALRGGIERARAALGEGEAQDGE